jgi:hypothetical protein
VARSVIQGYPQKRSFEAVSSSHRATTDEIEGIVFGIEGDLARFIERRSSDDLILLGETSGGR